MNRAETLFSVIDSLAYSFMNPKHIHSVSQVKNLPYGPELANNFDIFFSDNSSLLKPLLINIHGV
jgi:hypothetical protein